MPYSLDPITTDCYQETTVLINKLGIRDEAELAEAESVSVAGHAAIWEDNPKSNSFDFEHYKLLHHYLFSELYDWAGKIRTINISKKGTSFCPAKDIDSTAALIFSRLKTLNCFRDMNREEYIDAIVDLYCSTNYLHPFREGNGRCQRLFLTQLICAAGHELNFSEIDVDLLMLATIQSAQGVTDNLRMIFEHSIKFRRAESLSSPSLSYTDEDELAL